VRAGQRPSTEQLALLTKVALMYHEAKMRQRDIADELNIPQVRVSRMLALAEDLGIVRTTVVPPAELHAHLEQDLKRAFDLLDVVVAPAVEGYEHAVVGGAAAAYLEATLSGDERLGVSSWSESLLATVDAMRPLGRPLASQVVQLLGGVGNPQAQVSATRLAVRLSEVTGSEPSYVAAPGVVASREARDALLSDPYLEQVIAAWPGLTTALVGIGALEPSPLLAESGNTVSEADQAVLREVGAVGDVCLHFFDADGAPVDSSFDERVVGIPADVLRAVPRRIGIAGGMRKFEAIRASLRGRWVNILVTDSVVAQALLNDSTKP
jgi:DNA-binding transcriptional regulator LsrR (DeoR family)